MRELYRDHEARALHHRGVDLVAFECGPWLPPGMSARYESRGHAKRLVDDKADEPPPPPLPTHIRFPKRLRGASGGQSGFPGPPEGGGSGGQSGFPGPPEALAHDGQSGFPGPSGAPSFGNALQQQDEFRSFVGKLYLRIWAVVVVVFDSWPRPQPTYTQEIRLNEFESPWGFVVLFCVLAFVFD